MVLPDSHGISRVPQYSGKPSEELSVFIYRTVTFCGSAFQNDSTNGSLCNFGPLLEQRNMTAHYPDDATLPGLHIDGLGSFPFAHRYLGNRGYFLFLEVLRCFSSLRSLHAGYGFTSMIAVYYDGWVAPFGNLRIKGYLHLTEAYRSLSRPSSPADAKASTMCP